MDYLLKSTICLTAFYGLYFFGFRRLSFHTLNRFYLLVSLVLSLTIPLLSYERTEIVVIEPQPIEEAITPTEETQLIDNQEITIHQPTTIDNTSNATIDWMQVLNTIYLMGVGVMFFLFVKNLLTIVYCIKKTSAASCGTPPVSLSHRRSNKSLKILLTKSQSNSSFFNYIFLNPENLNPHEQELIIAHESFHAQRLHTLDLLILSIMKAIFWFNPIVYFYQKSLKQIHEYEVDALMSAMYDGREYAHLLLKLGIAPNTLITNQFSTKPLSERIQFLFKTPTKNMKKLLYFLSLPLIAVGVMAFAEEKIARVYQEKTLKSSIPKSVVEGKILAEKVIAKQTYNDTLKKTKINKIDSSRFSYNTNVKVPKNKVDSFNVISNQEYLVEGRDYVVKNNVIFLNSAYKNTKIAYRLYMKPLGSIIYPELTKLNKVEFPDMRFASKTPIVLAKNENNSLFRYTTLQTRPSTPFSKISKNQDTLRTILETNKLGKNPLVFINGEEYPSSVLYRINPDVVTSTAFYPPNNQSGIERFGEVAKDGIIKISTKEDDFIFKNDKQHKIAIENVKKRLIESKKRVRRQIYQNSNGVKYEEISIISINTGSPQTSIKLPFSQKGYKVNYFIDGKLTSEEEISNSRDAFIFVSVGKNKLIEEKYKEELKDSDVNFIIETKRN